MPYVSDDWLVHNSYVPNSVLSNTSKYFFLRFRLPSWLKQNCNNVVQNYFLGELRGQQPLYLTLTGVTNALMPQLQGCTASPAALSSLEYLRAKFTSSRKWIRPIGAISRKRIKSLRQVRLKPRREQSCYNYGVRSYSYDCLVNTLLLACCLVTVTWKTLIGQVRQL